MGGSPALPSGPPWQIDDGSRHLDLESFKTERLRPESMGFLHSFTTGSALDGQGVHVVVWTTGCQWRCRYCHNPDTWTMSNGLPVTLAKATEELSKYRHGLKIMSGGITVSGGEPLMQHMFVVKLLAAAQNMGIHTAIETNGHFGDRLTDDDLQKIDLVLLGMKTWDPPASPPHRSGSRPYPGVRRGGSRRRSGRSGFGSFWCRDSPTTVRT